MNPSTLETIKRLCDNSKPGHLEGWCSLSKATALCNELEAMDATRAIDLGVYGGRSMIPMALALRDLGPGRRVFGIDPWTAEASTEGGQASHADDAEAHRNFWSRLPHDRIMQGFMAQLAYLRLVNVAIPIRASSEFVAEFFADGSIDLLHIDGNHSFVASMRDERLYVPKVRPGGVVVLDDIQWHTNQAAVAALDATLERMFDVGDCRFYRKR